VFSEELLPPFTRAPFESLKDPNDDPVADAAELLERAGGKLAPLFGETRGGEAKRAAPDTKYLTVEHVTEWAASSWERLKQPPWEQTPEQYQESLKEIEAHQFWSELGPHTPSSPRIVSYHPITFVKTVHEALSHT
jgi:hypothetical protein